jgi:hypothetical protein
VKYFLLVYDRPRGALVEEPREFDDHLAALRVRFDRERNDHNANHEIVVLSGEDVESLKRTHSRYFGNQDGLERVATGGTS